jgi:capsular polysaccharide biosynthesis protein
MSAALYLRAVRRHWLIVAVFTLVGGLGLALAGMWLEPPAHTAHVRLIAAFGPSPSNIPGADAAADALNVDPRLIELRVRSYVQMATTSVVTGPVIETLHLPYTTGELNARITATAPLNSTFIDVDVTDRSAARATAIAQALADQLADLAVHERHTTVDQGKPIAMLRLSTVGLITVRTRPQTLFWRLRILAGAAGGFILGLGLATLRLQLATLRHSLAVTARHRRR